MVRHAPSQNDTADSIMHLKPVNPLPAFFLCARGIQGSLEACHATLSRRAKWGWILHGGVSEFVTIFVPNVLFCPCLSSLSRFGDQNGDKSGQKRTNGEKNGTFGDKLSTPRLALLYLYGKDAQCRQKVCSSKRPPKLEPRSVRANEVFENLACRISPE